MDGALLDIGQVARDSGLTTSTLRYYEDRGLIRPAGRHGLRRVYEPSVLRQLALIVLARQTGFGLDEIAGLLQATPADADLRARLAAKADELDAALARLTLMRDNLRHAAGCGHPRLADCPHLNTAVESTLPLGEQADLDRPAFPGFPASRA
ncbi:MerR family transcriptional regulator [Nonomuraea sp. LPB2021202275-12-8]|uniref:MerR family transcriptional regulator n=1 Tax=Nonomuraea sp. LPB2021202275-12-8 TaxID=3120159 RepID=UPI00300CF559